MTRHYCDLCKTELYVKNPKTVHYAVSTAMEIDLCNDCQKAIDKAKLDAEIQAVNNLSKRKE
jgi:hypothetical protein